jgi:cytochrome P450
MAIFNLTNITLTVLSIFAIRRIYYELTTGSRLRSLAKRHSTLHAPSRKSPVPSFIPTLGLDFIVANYRALKRNRLLESWQDELRNVSAHTVSANLLGTTLYLTDDPENVKQILATGFDAWGFPKERVDSLAEFLGHGVFTNEGKAWKHSRDMLRPCFERQQVADVALFEKHMERLMTGLPGDGETVDLLPVFQAFTLDVSTEFLFGRSTDSLVKDGEKSREAEEFVSAFEYCCDPFLSEKFQRWGYVGLFLPDGKHKRSCQTVKGMLGGGRWCGGGAKC